MNKLIEELKKDTELAKIVLGKDIEAAYQAANAVVPCDRAEFETFYNEQRAKSVAIIKVLKKAAADEEFAKVIYGENRKAAYEAAQTVSTGYTGEEFENVYKTVVAAALKTLHKDDEKLSDEELDMVTGGGWLIGLAKAVGGTLGGVIGIASGTWIVTAVGGAAVGLGAREIYDDVKDAKSVKDLGVSLAKDIVRITK